MPVWKMVGIHNIIGAILNKTSMLVVNRKWQGFSYPSGVEGRGTWGSGWGFNYLDPHTPVPLFRGYVYYPNLINPRA
jgi:hypothetical protein